jgi:hypothetical protein
VFAHITQSLAFALVQTWHVTSPFVVAHGWQVPVESGYWPFEQESVERSTHDELLAL